MNNVINFNSTDWNSIRDTINKINKIGCMQIGETSRGETITFDVTNCGDEDCLVTEVFQKNGWIHRRVYHPSDLTVEGSHKRG